MKWLIAEFIHETNTFCPLKPGRKEFADFLLKEGPSMIDLYRGTASCVGAFIDFADKHGIELLPTLAAYTTPAGPIQRPFYDWIKSTILAGLDQKADGVLLSLHGAAVIEGIDDGEGDLLEALRRKAGAGVPIAATLDFHTNLSRQMIENSDLLVGYKTYPHVDMYEAGANAARLLLATVRGEVRPVQAITRPGILAPLCNTYTNRPPMKGLVEQSLAIEREPGVLSATVFGGFPYADIVDAGMGTLVVADGDAALAQRKADELSARLWDVREQFPHHATPIPEAITRAMANPRRPVVLADVADNPGGGGLGEGVEILRELLARQVPDALVGPIWDPQAVAQCAAAGVGSTLELDLGAKAYTSAGKSVKFRATVTGLTSGEFTYRGLMNTGVRASIGPCAVVHCGDIPPTGSAAAPGIDVLIASRRLQNLDPEMFRSNGLEPTTRKIVVLKSSIHYRAAYEPIAAEIIEVDAPGLVSPNLAAFDFKHARP